MNKQMSNALKQCDNTPVVLQGVTQEKSSEVVKENKHNIGMKTKDLKVINHDELHTVELEVMQFLGEKGLCVQETLVLLDIMKEHIEWHTKKINIGEYANFEMYSKLNKSNGIAKECHVNQSVDVDDSDKIHKYVKWLEKNQTSEV